jgi:hypothetical protein
MGLKRYVCVCYSTSGGSGKPSQEPKKLNLILFWEQKREMKE